MSFTPQGTGFPTLIPRAGLLADSASRTFDLGQLVQDTRGNTYRYVQANEALVAGDVVTAVAEGAWDSGILADGAGADGDTKIHVDTITTAKAANFYAGYYITQATAAAKGKCYRIKSHDAMAASGEIDLFLDDPLDEAFADNVAIRIFHPSLVEKIDATTEVNGGVAVVALTANQYGFVQVGGFCPHVKIGHSTSAAVVLNEPLTPVGSGNAGAMQGMAGNAEGDIMEAAASSLIALRASGANTTGFAPALFRGILI